MLAATLPDLNQTTKMQATSKPYHILELPSEILQNILLKATTPTFLQATLTCRNLFDLAAQSRAVLLHHLHDIPGLKLGLSDHSSISTRDLFITLRRRAAANLYGVNFTADRTDFFFRHATLDSDACYLAEGREYINIGLALKESLSVRLYGGKCVRKEVIESPYGDGKGRVLKILQWNTTITVFYSWIDEDENALGGGQTSNDSQFRKYRDTVFRKLRRRRSRSLSLTSPMSSISSNRSRSRSPSPSHRRTFVDEATQHSSPLKFHLLHHNAYSFSKPIFFSIPRYKDHLVPITTAVSGRLKCAVLWDREKSVRPSPEATVVLYTADCVPRGEEGVYDGRQIWPPPRTARSETDRIVTIDRPPPEIFPREIALFHDGHRLALYAPGQIVPYEVMTTNGAIPSTLSNQVLLGSPANFWTIDRPFWGNHETYTEKVDVEDDEGDADQEPEERTYCQHTYLCLGTAIIDGVKIAGVLRSRTRKDHDQCRHLVEYDGMPHTNSNSKIVARLWGWKESLCTLPGVVAWSGWSSSIKFVAVADWDKILVWAVAVAELGEEFEDDSSGEGDDGSDDEVDAVDTGLAKGKSKQKKEKEEPVEFKGYYEKVWDENLEVSLVDLKPILLKMGLGGVVRKMVWSRHTDGDESDEEAEESAEEEDANMSDEINLRDVIAGRKAPEPSASYDGNGDVILDTYSNAFVSEGVVASEAAHITEAVTYAEAEQPGGESSGGKQKGKKRRNRPGLRLKVLTDRGVSIWELGVWAKGRRRKESLDEVVA